MRRVSEIDPDSVPPRCGPGSDRSVGTAACEVVNSVGIDHIEARTPRTAVGTVADVVAQHGKVSDVEIPTIGGAIGVADLPHRGAVC